MKGTIRITKEFNFEMAHSLDDHLGKCRNIHGHSYQLNVTIIGSPRDEAGHPENGMLIDFAILKNIVKANIIEKLDHFLMLWKDSPFLKNNETLKKTNLIVVSFQPTCENMTLYIANILKDKLPEGINLHSIFLRETATSYAEWLAEDNI